MRRVLIVGPGGAGKSTFAVRLGERLKLPVVHLDRHYWSAGWKEPLPDEWEATVRHLAARDAWVMDGNFGGTLHLRLPRADTVVLLDLPPLLCLWRVLVRRVRYHGRSRPSMAAGCPERLDLDFLRWIWTYRRTSGARLLRRLHTDAGDRRVVVLRSRQAADRFLAQLVPTGGDARV